MFKQILKISAVSLVLFGVVFGVEVYSNPPPKHVETPVEHIQKIYDKLWTETGMIDDKVPLVVDPSDVLNAFATSESITIYQGIINFSKNDDEIAWILGHEISHVTSGDVNDNTNNKDNDFLINKLDDGGIYLKETLAQSKIEGRADKMGAVYMMKAGYNICKARELWVRFAKQEGDYIFANHPGMAYRYSQMNIGCSSGL